MTDFARRTEFERRIERELRERGQGWLARTIRRRGRWDGAFWRAMEQECADTLSYPLAGAYLAMAEQEMGGSTIGVEWGGLSGDAWEWATRRAAAEAVLIVGRTQRVCEADVEPEDPEQAWAALFGDTRAELIGITNTTAAAWAGSSGWAAQAQKDNPGLVLMAIWQTARDERVCPRCGPLQGKARGLWWIFGPPVHMRCRCWTIWIAQ